MYSTTVLETGDHGSFNSWGRDRFWSTDYNTINNRIAADPTQPSQIPLLDMLHPITIQNSRWRCDHGWDIDLDDGSSWYIVKNNLCLGGGIKLREGFYRTVENNITVTNTFHPHVWFNQSGDIVRKNIWATQYQDIQVSAWGQEVDQNYFYTRSALNYSQGKGQDANGGSGDPLYSSPATLDYTVNEASSELSVLSISPWMHLECKKHHSNPKQKLRRSRYQYRAGPYSSKLHHVRCNGEIGEHPWGSLCNRTPGNEGHPLCQRPNK